MGYDALVKKNIQQAFRAIGDLATVVTFTQKNSTSYDFSTKSTNLSTPVTTTISGLFIDLKRNGSSKELSSTTLIGFQFMSTDMDDPDVYDTVTLPDGKVYTIVPPSKNDGYLITVTLAREA